MSLKKPARGRGPTNEGPPKQLKTFKAMLKNDESYSVTVNANDAGQFFSQNLLHRPRSCVEYYTDLFKTLLAPWCTYTMRPELSGSSRWHYHGVITVKDSFKYHCHYAHRLKKLSHFDVDTIDDPEIWLAYCTKDYEVMYPQLKHMKLPYVLDNESVIKKPKQKNNFDKYLPDAVECPLETPAPIVQYIYRDKPTVSKSSPPQDDEDTQPMFDSNGDIIKYTTNTHRVI